LTDDRETVEIEHYREKYQSVRVERTGGILQLTFHTDGGPFRMSGAAHRELADAFYNVSADHANKVVIMTGTGNAFCDGFDRGTYQLETAEDHARTHYEGRRLLQNLLDIEAVVLSAINGPSWVHCFPVVADICLCASHTTFRDGHVASGGVPVGDGANIVWQHLLGPTRGKYFLLLGQLLSAEEALRLGVVNEVLPQEQLLPRAWELAEILAAKPATTLRYSRLILNQQYRRLVLDDLAFSYGMQKLGSVTQAELPYGQAT
jgi:enoyl-CoA hydratase/carnithine racemase